MGIPETKSSLDIRSAVASLRAFATHDGTWIINDPDVGSVSARSKAEAEQEVQRRKAELKGRAA